VRDLPLRGIAAIVGRIISLVCPLNRLFLNPPFLSEKRFNSVVIKVRNAVETKSPSKSAPNLASNAGECVRAETNVKSLLGTTIGDRLLALTKAGAAAAANIADKKPLRLIVILDPC
jgi:hypothetical protein